MQVARGVAAPIPNTVSSRTRARGMKLWTEKWNFSKSLVFVSREETAPVSFPYWGS